MATWATNKLIPPSPAAPGGLPVEGAAQGLDLPALDRAAGSRKEGLAGGPSSRQVAGGGHPSQLWSPISSPFLLQRASPWHLQPAEGVGNACHTVVVVSDDPPAAGGR